MYIFQNVFNESGAVLVVAIFVPVDLDGYYGTAVDTVQEVH